MGYPNQKTLKYIFQNFQEQLARVYYKIDNILGKKPWKNVNSLRNKFDPFAKKLKAP